MFDLDSNVFLVGYGVIDQLVESIHVSECDDFRFCIVPAGVNLSLGADNKCAHVMVNDLVQHIVSVYVIEHSEDYPWLILVHTHCLTMLHKFLNGVCKTKLTCDCNIPGEMVVEWEWP